MGVTVGLTPSPDIAESARRSDGIARGQRRRFRPSARNVGTVRRRSIKKAILTGHRDDTARSASPLVRRQILRLHPSGITRGKGRTPACLLPWYLRQNDNGAVHMLLATFDQIDDLIKVLAWPLVTVFLLGVYRRPIAGFANSVISRMSAFSWRGTTIHLIPATEASGVEMAQFQDAMVTEDLIVSDSGSALFSLIHSAVHADYAQIDLGAGDKWLTTRLYEFSRILETLLGIRRIIFVEKHGAKRRFLGIAESESIWRSLGTQFPWIDELFRAAMITGGVGGQCADLSDPFAAESVARAFLYDERVRRQLKKRDTAIPDWTRVRPVNPNMPDTEESLWWVEHANWITKTDLLAWLGLSLDRSSVKVSANTTIEDRNRAIFQCENEIVAIVDRRANILGVANRTAMVNTLVRRIAKSAEEDRGAPRRRKP